MIGPRWEKERAAWVLTRAGRNRAARRRGEKLAATARRQDRYAAGIGDSLYGEVTTRNVVYRSIMREEGAANIWGWCLWTATWIGGLAILAGPGILLSLAIYGLWWSLADRLGPMRPGPLVLFGALATVVGAVAIKIVGSDVAATYILAQVVVGVLRGAWMTRAYGWPAVAAMQRRRTDGIDAIEIEDIAVPAIPIKPTAPAVDDLIIEIDGMDIDLDDFVLSNEKEGE